MPLNWQSLTSEMTDVQRLVHLAMRFDSVDEEQWRGEILRMRRNAYDAELGVQAAAVGCAGRRGNLGNGDILSGLNSQSLTDAQSIANTYNYKYLARHRERC